MTASQDNRKWKYFTGISGAFSLKRMWRGAGFSHPCLSPWDLFGISKSKEVILSPWIIGKLFSQWNGKFEIFLFCKSYLCFYCLSLGLWWDFWCILHLLCYTWKIQVHKRNVIFFQPTLSAFQIINMHLKVLHRNYCQQVCFY